MRYDLLLYNSKLCKNVIKAHVTEEPWHCTLQYFNCNRVTWTDMCVLGQKRTFVKIRKDFGEANSEIYIDYMHNHDPAISSLNLACMVILEFIIRIIVYLNNNIDISTAYKISLLFSIVTLQLKQYTFSILHKQHYLINS